MKKSNLLLSIFTTLILFGVIMVLSNCEGPEGPEGPSGVDGINGANGINGIDGTDGTNGVAGNAVCLTCHNLANKIAKNTQYAMSDKMLGHYVGYAGGRQGCATCHSHEGFVETMYTGADTTQNENGVPYPTPFSCKTCHDFHSTLDFENDGDDYALRRTKPITLIMDETVTIDFKNSTNLCGYCHQPRRAMGDPDANDSFRITSTHWGPHHGPQSTLLWGIGCYEFTGSANYPTAGVHKHAEAGCSACHMHDYAADHGGHTFKPSVAGCTPCHSSATTMDIAGKQTEVRGLLDDIEAILVTSGVYNDVEDHPVVGTHKFKYAAAYYNWIGITEDRSSGAHNPDYIIAVLKNTKAVIQ